MNPELRDLKVEWVELPSSGSGDWFLHVAQTHGDGTVTKLWLTRMQANEIADVAGSRR